MAIALTDLASTLGLTESEMRKLLLELGFEDNPEIEDEVADLVKDEVAGRREKSAAEVYEKIVEEAQEKEIVKSQRKQKAGKVVKKTEVRRTEPSVVKKDNVEIHDMISVKELAEKTGLSAAVLIGALMKNGILASLNQVIDYDTAMIITDGMGVQLKKHRGTASAEDLFKGDLEKLLGEDEKADLKRRPPVVCVMGHVDHGKTTLLDAIRNAKVVDSEAGGITQHIGAYQVELKGQKITFLDTPGHEAFTAMRARGARATDIAILVVAADDGVMPQTIEAINHAKEANVPVIVAINKIDKPDANLNKIKAELVEYGLQSEEWGGQTIMVPISAKNKQGIDALLESVLLVAEMMELKANPNRPAVATVVESHLDLSLGPVATILVNTGTLNVGDNFIVGQTYGRIKRMRDHTGRSIKTLGPSDTAQIAGLHDPVESGQILQAVKDEKMARQRAMQVHDMAREQLISAGMGMQEILQRIKDGSLKLLKVVIKADTQGSLEAIKQALAKIKNDDVAIKVIHSGVGSITESDVLMGAASPGTLVVGFHTEAGAHVKRLAERMGIEVVTYKIIYELIEDLRKILSGLLQPETLLVELGKFKVMKIFFTGKNEYVVGGKITEGILKSKSNVRVLRDGKPIGDGKIVGLKLVNEDMDELDKGNECGVRYQGKVKLEEHDVLEAWREEKKMKTL